MHKYRLIRKLGEGTFSEVLKAQSLRNGQNVAIKCMKSHFDNIDQVNNLREIKALQRLYPHPHIIQLIEILYDEPTGRLALVFELMEQNLYEAIKGRPNYLPEQRVKHYMYQLIKAIEHMHRKGIFHRDIKPENILLTGDTVKLADLGSCRGLYQEMPLTEYISTRWYRAPECLLTDGYYSYKMDIWGVGCVMFEVLSLCPLFPGDDELDQINKIHDAIGTPSREILEYFRKHATHMEINFQTKKGKGFAHLIPHVSQDGQELIAKMLIYDKDERWTASQLMRHVYFKEFRDFDHQQISQFTHGPGGFTRSISSNLNDNLSAYSRRNSDNASDVEVGSGSNITTQHLPGAGQSTYNIKKTKKGKVVKKKDAGQHHGQKKFPELKMVVNGDYRGSNYTMSSDDEVFNFPPIKASMQHHGKDTGSVYSNQIVKPVGKKKPNPKLTMNMAGLGFSNQQQQLHHKGLGIQGHNQQHGVNQTSGQLSLQASSLTGLTNMHTDAATNIMMSGNSTGLNASGVSGGPSGHELKIKHNSSNQSFHSQKKAIAGANSTVIGGSNGMQTIRKPGAKEASPVINDAGSFANLNHPHNQSLNGGVNVSGVSMGFSQVPPGGSTSNMTNKNGGIGDSTKMALQHTQQQFSKYMSPYQKSLAKKGNSTNNALI